jgi:hypothetical protein
VITWINKWTRRGKSFTHKNSTPVILVIWEAEIRRITIQGQPRQIAWETSISKITRAKWTGGVLKQKSTCFASGKLWVQTLVPPKKGGRLAECLKCTAPTKHEALSSNSSTTKTTTKKRIPNYLPSMIHASNPSIQEVVAGGSWVWDQPVSKKYSNIYSLPHDFPLPGYRLHVVTSFHRKGRGE